MIWIRYIPKIIADEAPTHFRVAMVRILPARKSRTALLTPTPPTSSATSPTSIMNSDARSTSRLIDGDALLRSRTIHWASGKAASSSRFQPSSRSGSASLTR